MVKMTYCMHRLPHLSHGDFLRYWLEEHGPMIRSHAPAMKMARYLQFHVVDDALNEGLRGRRGGQEPYDGVAEMWWETRADFDSAFTTDEGRAAGRAIMADEKTFVDMARSTIMFGEEKTLIGD